MTLKINRREFIASGAALAAYGVGGARAAASTDLRAQVAEIQLLPEQYGTTQIWGYDGKAPGPEIRVRQGERVQKRLINDLPQATSVHWHGIRIDNAMDGVAGLTQNATAPGDAFDYDFVAPDAGTFWYHSHNRSFEQVERGLHGALIVDESEPLDVDREEVVILDDWLINPETTQIADSFDELHFLSHDGRIGNYITTNGSYSVVKQAKRHDRIRLRVINASNARVFQLVLDGLEGWLVAQDGMPLKKPSPVTETILLGPAQRVDLIVDVTAEVGSNGYLVRLEQDEGYSQIAFEVTGESAGNRRPAPNALPPNSVPLPDLTEARTIDLLMEGGAMGGMQGAMMGGRMATMREIVDTGNFWAFNGAIGGMDGEPLARASRGESIRLKIANDTAFPHAIHLHGMHFYEILPDGTLGSVRDTTLLDRGEARDVAFVADNPGKWLLHCHMLSHAASGMMARIDVA